MNMHLALEKCNNMLEQGMHRKVKQPILGGKSVSDRNDNVAGVSKTYLHICVGVRKRMTLEGQKSFTKRSELNHRVVLKKGKSA